MSLASWRQRRKQAHTDRIESARCDPDESALFTGYVRLIFNDGTSEEVLQVPMKRAKNWYGDAVYRNLDEFKIYQIKLPERDDMAELVVEVDDKTLSVPGASVLGRWARGGTIAYGHEHSPITSREGDKYVRRCAVCGEDLPYVAPPF